MAPHHSQLGLGDETALQRHPAAFQHPTLVKTSRETWRRFAIKVELQESETNGHPTLSVGPVKKTLSVGWVGYSSASWPDPGSWFEDELLHNRYHASTSDKALAIDERQFQVPQDLSNN